MDITVSYEHITIRSNIALGKAYKGSTLFNNLLMVNSLI